MTLSKANIKAIIPKSKYYNWDRYWKAVDIEKPDLYDEGFLIEKNDYANKHLKELKDLEDRSCLILIGEPGIGKSKTIERFKSKIAL